MFILVSFVLFKQAGFVAFGQETFKMNLRKIESVKEASEIDTSIVIKTKSKSGLDTVVIYSAKDSVIFLLNDKKMLIQGKANLIHKEQNLESEIIVLDFQENTLSADGVTDSTGKLIGYPKYTDKGETFFGKSLKYNFKSKEGLIVFGETEIDDGYYFAKKVKKKGVNQMYLEDGCFTTCEHPEPHYYFGSSKMELLVQDRVFIEPITFYIEDMPIITVPLGLFFSLQKGRRSGLVIPSFYFSNTRGVTLDNFGVYLALSDYYDTRFTADYFSKGGFTLKNFTQWKYQDILSGNLKLEFGRTRFNPNDEYTRNWNFVFSHNQSITPQDRIVANLNFSSQDFNRNTQWNQNQRIVQDITSNASYSSSFDNGSSFSVSYNRSQNIITNAYTQTPTISFTLPQYSLFKSFVTSDNWLSNIIFSYSANATYQDRKTVSTAQAGGETVDELVYSQSSKIVHSPRLSITLPKLSYFTFTPYFNFSLNNYFRRVRKFYDLADSSEKKEYEKGFFTEYSYDAGISVSTKLYGLMKPKLFGINAIRHTLQPNFSFSFRPDQSNPDLGFYNSYLNPLTNTEIIYSRYETDGGGIASRQFSSALNYQFLNSFSAKIKQGDTLEDKTVDFFSFNLNGNYDFAKTFRRLSDVSISFHSSTIPGINFSGNSRYTLYNEEFGIDSINQSRIVIPSNDLLIASGKGLARMTSLGISLSTGFSSSGALADAESERQQETEKEELSLGERFSQRLNKQDDFVDFFGESVPGYNGFAPPWSISFNVNYNYNRPTIATKTETFTLGSNFTFSLTPTWFLNGSVQFDILTGAIVSPIVNVRKDLHCWELNFTWYPIGFNRGFYLRFNIKSPMLKDLKYEQRSSDFF